MTYSAHPAGDRPMFSVLVATYNQASFIRDTLDSVAAQSCGDYELVIVDDGSTDATEAVVSQWIAAFRRSRSNRVVFSRIANGGQSAAMEHGFALCRGRYICLLDSDDRWVPEKLAMVYAAACRNPDAGMIAHPLYVIDPRGKRTGDVRPKRAPLSEGDLREQVRRTGRMVASATSGMVLKAEVFQQLVPMPTKGYRAHADAYLAYGASLLAPICSVPEPLAEYRLHPHGNHLGSMLTAEGLEYLVGLQSTVARHFQLEDALQRDSYFTRHDFARAKLQDGITRQVAALHRLVRATFADRSFRYSDRILFGAYWVVCFLSPPPVFRYLWYRFQLKATGYDKVLRGAA